MKARIQHRKADRESRGSCDDFLRRKSEGGGGASASTDRRSVFLSGSRSRAVIPKVVQDSLETIMSNGFNILIGDSDKGVDKEIIDFLCVPLYENVVLYSVPPERRCGDRQGGKDHAAIQKTASDGTSRSQRVQHRGRFGTRRA